MNKTEIQKVFAEINNLAMQIIVSGDDVMRLATIMLKCQDSVASLEEEDGNP